MRFARTLVAALALAGVGACSKPVPQAGMDNQDASNPSVNDQAAASAPAENVPATMVPAPVVPQNTNDPVAFVPLQSAAVKDAIHRALGTGQTQRWKDGKLSGYAVPSTTTDRNGCRAVRYTVDQRRTAPFETINACDASR